MQNVIILTAENDAITNFLTTLFQKLNPKEPAPVIRTTLPPVIQPQTDPNPAKTLWIKHFGHRHITARMFNEYAKNNAELRKTFLNAVKPITTQRTSSYLSTYTNNHSWLHSKVEFSSYDATHKVLHFWAE